MMIELSTAAAKLVPVLNYDGMPITANKYLQADKREDGKGNLVVPAHPPCGCHVLYKTSRQVWLSTN